MFILDTSFADVEGWESARYYTVPQWTGHVCLERHRNMLGWMNHVWAFRRGTIYVNVTEIVSKCVSSWEAHLSESFWKCSSRRILEKDASTSDEKRWKKKWWQMIRGRWKCRIQELNSRVIVSGIAVKSWFWMWGDKRGLDVYFFYFLFPCRLLCSSELFVFWVCVFTSFCYCVRPMK